jgi:hypothetical protein
MVIYMKDNLNSMIKMVTENLLIQMDIYIKDNEEIILKMVNGYIS